MSAPVAIVAGAGGALGHATAVTLAARGLTVVAVDRNERGLRELPGDVRAELADATDPAAAELGNLRGDDHGRWMHSCPLGFDLADSIAGASSSPFGRIYGR